MRLPIIVLVSIVTLSLISPILASANQTLHNANEAEVSAKGVLGNPDNTDPGEAIPEGSDKWINVTLPITVIFNSDEKNNHKTIVSPTNYKVTNNSGRPVKVSLLSFNEKTANQTTALQRLNLTAIQSEFSEVVLIDNNSIIATETDLVVLGDKNGEIAGKSRAKEFGFKFTGTVDTKILSKDNEIHKKEKAHYTMIYKFKALSSDGENITS